MVEAWVRAPVQPTEGAGKVEAAVRSLFPQASLEADAWGLRGQAGSLDRFAQAIREQRIPDTARGVLLRGQDGATAKVRLNKQAMAAGKLNFATREGPLGDVEVEFRGASAQEVAAFIDQVAPDTRAWTLEERGLTAEGLAAKERDEGILDDLEHDAEP
jgi:predicted RNA binding protein with dsRBD fold (UPF0201 family)